MDNIKFKMLLNVEQGMPIEGFRSEKELRKSTFRNSSYIRIPCSTFITDFALVLKKTSPLCTSYNYYTYKKAAV